MLTLAPSAFAVAPSVRCLTNFKLDRPPSYSKFEKPLRRPIRMNVSSPATPPPPPPSAQQPQNRYCQECATQMEWRVPDGDERKRLVCLNCGHIAYENPRVVVGVVPVTADNERVLLVRRAIPPRVGKWTIPAGFLELGETTHAAAQREAFEEANAQIEFEPLTLLAVYNILPAKQVQLVYRGTLLNEDSIKPGIESQETRLFSWEDLPKDDELAFRTNGWALTFARKNRERRTFQPDLKSR